MIILKTKRLVVKATSRDNFENNYALLSDPEVMRYVGRGVKTREEVLVGVEKIIQHQEKYGVSIGEVYEKKTGLFIGRSGLIHLEMNNNQPEIEIGYALHKQFWQKGYATELTKAFIEWGFQHLPVDRLVAVVYPENNASKNVLEKAGMHYVGRVICYDAEVDKYEILKT